MHDQQGMGIVNKVMALPQDIYCFPKGELSASFSHCRTPPSSEDESLWTRSSSPALVQRDRMLKSKLQQSMIHLSRGLRSTKRSSPTKKRRTRNSRSGLTGARKSSISSCLSIFQKEVQLLQTPFNRDDSSPTCQMSFSSCGESTTSSALHEELNIVMHEVLPSSQVVCSNISWDQWLSPEHTFQRTVTSEDDLLPQDAFTNIGWESINKNDCSGTTEIFQESSIYATMQEATKLFPFNIPFNSPQEPGLKRSKAFGSGLDCMTTANTGFLRNMHH